jgi:hypothetical protein
VFVDGLSVNATDQYTQAVHDDSRELAWLVWKPLTNLIAVGHDVYGVHEDVHLNRAIVALDSETGKSLWAAPLPRLSADDRRPIVAVAPGLLLVATAGKIVAFRSALRPARGGVALGAGAFDVIAGRPFGLIGVLGADLRGPRPDVALEAAGWRAGGFRRVGSLRPDRDGGFAGGLTTRRNARFRASAGGATSNVVTVYAYPHFKLGPFRPLGRTRAQTTGTVSAEGARFGGHSLVLYLQRHGSPRLVRLGAGSLRAPHRGRARATIGFLPPRHASSRDLVFVCVTRQLRLGLGRPSPLTRRCGARVLARP